MDSCGVVGEEGLVGSNNQNTCDSLGVRKRPVGQTHHRFRQGLVWQEVGAAPTVPPPPYHHHHRHHPLYQRHRQRYHENLHQCIAELPVNPAEPVNLATRSGGFEDELFAF